MHPQRAPRTLCVSSTHDPTLGLRTLRRQRHDDFVRAGIAKPLVHSCLRCLMRPRLNLRFSPGCMAVWNRGSHLVVNSVAPLVEAITKNQLPITKNHHSFFLIRLISSNLCARSFSLPSFVGW